MQIWFTYTQNMSNICILRILTQQKPLSDLTNNSNESLTGAIRPLGHCMHRHTFVEEEEKK